MYISKEYTPECPRFEFPKTFRESQFSVFMIYMDSSAYFVLKTECHLWVFIVYTLFYSPMNIFNSSKVSKKN